MTIEDDEGVVSHHALSGDRCTIGRARDRDLVLPEVTVSRRHAYLERWGGGWRIVDEGSDNGTFVNGGAITGPTPIGVNDTVQLGGYRVGLSSGESGRELPPPPAPVTPARLRVIAGHDVGAEFSIEQKDFVTIGSGRDCAIRFSHENIAPLHATIRTVPGGRYELSDRSGTGLLFVNGRPLVGEQVLEGGDAINIGGVILLRFLEPSQWPDPRYDMVSHPDSWLSVDLVPPDDRPTLEEIPEVDVEPLADEPLVVLELPDEQALLTKTPYSPIRRMPIARGPAEAAARASGAGEAGAAGPNAGASGRGAATGPGSGAVEQGSPVGRNPGAVEQGEAGGRSSGVMAQGTPVGRGSGVIEQSTSGAAAEKGAAAEPPAGAGERPAEDDTTPVSSRRKMLATLRRLASW
ncbi:MAG TPA: FHA domain-containing protein [Polyangiaceae bacterium]|nr:FHA domain-containing protein [Polyangiaceae bacterium]